MLINQIVGILFNILALSALLSFKAQPLRWAGYTLCFIVQVYLYYQLKEQNYYQQYDIPRTFDKGQLRQAYKRIMIEYHPDKNQHVTLSQFETLKSINEILKNEDTQLIYNTYGPYKPSNIDPLPALKSEVYLIRILVYMIQFLAISVETAPPQYKSQRKMFMVIIGAGYFGEHFIFEDPMLALRNGILVGFTLFELVMVFRILISLVLSYLVADIKVREKDKQMKIEQLDLQQLNELVKEHTEYLNQQDSKRQKILNGCSMVLMSGFAIWQFKQNDIFNQQNIP